MIAEKILAGVVFAMIGEHYASIDDGKPYHRQRKEDVMSQRSIVLIWEIAAGFFQFVVAVCWASAKYAASKFAKYAASN